MKRFLAFLGLTAALAAVLSIGAAPPPVTAQVNPFRTVIVPSTNATAVSTGVTAVSTAPALLIKYVGTSSSATFALTSDDFLFTTDGTTADTTINVQATTPCGASVGTLDTADGDCNTVTELVNEINASANWVAVPIGVLGTDDAGAYFVDVTETVSNAAGVACYNDSATTLQTTNAFFPPGPNAVPNAVDIRNFMASNTLLANPWNGYISVLDWYIQNFVGSAGAGAVYAVRSNVTAAKVYSETVRTVYSFTGAATGVDKELDFKTAPLFLNDGEHFVFRGASGSTHTSPVQRARGFIVKK